jgi:hypothetical protein
MNKLFVMILCLIVSMGCATQSVFVLPETQIQDYKNAYIEQAPNKYGKQTMDKTDKYGIGARIFRELTQMGLLIVKDPKLADLRVVYAYYEQPFAYGRHYLDQPTYYVDMAGFKITLYDTKEDKMVADITFEGGGFWFLSTPEKKLNKGFKMLKSKMKKPDAE